MSVLLTILGISLLIVLHELGHYLVARAFDMRVLRFSIGFGPQLWGRTVGETTWQIAAIPLGGFVQIDGMGPADPDAPDALVDDPRSFRNKATWQRGLVLFAGPGMNWLLAAVFVMFLAFTVGFQRDRLDDMTVGAITPGGPAAEAGLLEGDVIVRVDGAPIADWNELIDAVRDRPEESKTFTVNREGVLLDFDIAAQKDDDGNYRIMIGPTSETYRRGFFGSIAFGFVGAWRLTQSQIGLLWGMLTGTKEGRLAGLPGIVKMVSAQAKRGMARFLETLASLSITLALLNLLPIPALDGSRLVFVGIESVRRRPINQQLEAVVHGVGFLLLIGLMIFVSVRDLL